MVPLPKSVNPGLRWLTEPHTLSAQMYTNTLSRGGLCKENFSQDCGIHIRKASAPCSSTTGMSHIQDCVRIAFSSSKAGNGPGHSVQRKAGGWLSQEKCILLTQLGLGKLLTRKDLSGRSTACQCLSPGCHAANYGCSLRTLPFTVGPLHA